MPIRVQKDSVPSVSSAVKPLRVFSSFTTRHSESKLPLCSRCSLGSSKRDSCFRVSVDSCSSVPIRVASAFKRVFFSQFHISHFHILEGDVDLWGGGQGLARAFYVQIQVKIEFFASMLYFFDILQWKRTHIWHQTLFYS